MTGSDAGPSESAMRAILPPEDGRHDLVSVLEGLGVEVGDQSGIGEVVGGQAAEGIGADLGEPGPRVRDAAGIRRLSVDGPAG
jgi:hypothetical protein